MLHNFRKLIASVFMLGFAVLTNAADQCQLTTVLRNSDLTVPLKAQKDPPKDSDYSVWLGIYPEALTVDKKGNIYIADQLNHRIIAINQQGTVIREINIKNKPDQIRRYLTALAVDDEETVYVVNQYNTSIEIYSRSNELIRSIKYYISKVRDPNFLAVDDKKNIYLFVKPFFGTVFSSAGKLLKDNIQLNNGFYTPIVPLPQREIWGSEFHYRITSKYLKGPNYKPGTEVTKEYTFIVEKDGITKECTMVGLFPITDADGVFLAFDKQGSFYFIDEESLDVIRINIKLQTSSFQKDT